jgi:hypothetical protein
MKTAWSHIGVLLLCISVALFGAASNAGMVSDASGTEMVICADGGPKTITVDTDGNPVSPAPRCCDCVTCNVPTTAFLGTSTHFNAAPSQFRKLTVAAAHQTLAPIIIAQPQARGPPLASKKTGVRTMPCCGLVNKDATV